MQEPPIAAGPAADLPPEASLPSKAQDPPVVTTVAWNAAGFFDSIQGFITTVQSIMQPSLDAMEQRLRNDLLARRAELEASRGGHETVVYKTPMIVYAVVVMSLLFSIIAISR